ncbi:Transmembrane protein 41A [Mortierella alpina]|nr:Transmembrane protein 41A [Mortierella alpina]
MSTIVATANAASAATTAALGRLYSAKSDSTLHSAARQRSSSFTLKAAARSTPHHGSSTQTSLRSSYPSSLPASASSSAALTRKLSRGVSQHEETIAHRDLSAPLSPSDYSGLSLAESTGAASVPAYRAQQHQEQGIDRINLVPAPTDSIYSSRYQNNKGATGTALSDLRGNQAQENTSTVCTGRSRSNTLTNSGAGAAEAAVASINSQLDHVMRPRRPSLVNGTTGTSFIPALPTIILSPDTSKPSGTAAPHSHYPPASGLPHYAEVTESKGSDEESGTESTKLAAPISSPWGNLRLGFLPRILVLIGLFGLSLGGLYLLAQVLPPLSLPKSIDDVKVDSKILQEFATATYEGWIRTFWVFSVVYMWKQCFGIPGSAFLNILAGALYGPWFGTVLTSLLTTLGSVLAYFMSFFLMEPILNRYASSRLDQMRLQIQKKTRSTKPSASARSSTAISTAVQTSINGSSTSTSAAVASAAASLSGSSSAQRGTTLRTRSSSFTMRRAESGQADLSSLPAYAPSHYASSTGSPTTTTTASAHFLHSEIEVQESEGLLREDRTDMEKATGAQDEESAEGDRDADNEDEDDSEGTSLFMQLLLIRLFPLTPYWFINLASPLVGVPVVPFMTSMFLGCMPYNYICAQAGAILGEIHELRDIYQQPWILFQIVLVLVLSSLAVWISKRSKKRQMENDQSQRSKSRSSEDEMESDDETTHRLLGSSQEVEHHRQQPQHYRKDEEDEDTIPMSPIGHQSRSTASANKRDSAIIDMTEYRY